MKKTLFFSVLSFLLSLAPNAGSAQNDFREGFIINLLQDTIRGLVDFRSNAQNYKTCRFKLGQDVVEYTPSEIEGFGYDQDKVFTSTVSEGTFVEVLVDGELSLYRSKSHFLLKRPGGAIHRFVHDEPREQAGISAANRWLGIFKLLLNDCPGSLVERRGNFG
jgi:hypothetical protein